MRNTNQGHCMKYVSGCMKWIIDFYTIAVSQASLIIEQLTGIKQGLTQTGSFLKSLGFPFRKVGAIPSKTMTEGKK